MKEWKRLSGVNPTGKIGNGIFTALQEMSVPWQSLNMETELDLEYYNNISGQKIISPLTYSMMIGETLTLNDLDVLATVIFKIYSVRWNKLWDTLSFEYDPIQNYSMTEIMTDDETVIEYGKVKTIDGTNTRTPNLTETETPNVTRETEMNRFGFNSSEPVPSDTETETQTGTDTTTTTGTDETEIDSTETDSGSDTHTRNYTLSRAGNIGVTTSQEMIESERKLWMWDFFHDIVFPDIDRVLTINIY